MNKNHYFCKKRTIDIPIDETKLSIYIYTYLAIDRMRTPNRLQQTVGAGRLIDAVTAR